jgi:hypothetical protein
MTRWLTGRSSRASSSSKRSIRIGTP